MRLSLVMAAVLGASAIGFVAFAQTEQKLARLNYAETELTGEQARNMNQLARLLSVLVEIRRDPPPALLVSPADARDAVRAAILVKAMTPELQQRARIYAREAADMMRRRRLAAVESEALFTAESERADAAPEPGAAAPPPLAPPPAPVQGPTRPPESLLAPTPGRIVRRFGDPTPSGGRSNGLTWAAPGASRVICPAAGTVRFVGPVKGWGVVLIFELAGGYHLVLAGLDRSSLGVGQSVAPGQPVGWTPDARQSTSELYLEVREQGAPVDPSRWIVGGRAER